MKLKVGDWVEYTKHVAQKEPGDISIIEYISGDFLDLRDHSVKPKARTPKYIQRVRFDQVKLYNPDEDE